MFQWLSVGVVLDFVFCQEEVIEFWSHWVYGISTYEFDKFTSSDSAESIREATRASIMEIWTLEEAVPRTFRKTWMPLAFLKDILDLLWAKQRPSITARPNFRHESWVISRLPSKLVLMKRVGISWITTSYEGLSDTWWYNISWEGSLTISRVMWTRVVYPLIRASRSGFLI